MTEAPNTAGNLCVSNCTVTGREECQHWGRERVICECQHWGRERVIYIIYKTDSPKTGGGEESTAAISGDLLLDVCFFFPSAVNAPLRGPHCSESGS